MASEVDICNMSLGYLGDDATVSSLSPPEGSVQADHCARFYPIARDSLLEMNAWGFASRRASLALLSETPPSPWLYSYAQPADALNLMAILSPDALDDYSMALPMYGDIRSEILGSPLVGHMGAQGVYTPQPFSNEVNPSGAQVIYTNQENAVLRYTALVTDPTQFTPLFTESLAWLLAAKLAGPILKGTAGMEASQACMAQFKIWFGQATVSDANQQKHTVTHNVAWLANR